MIITTNKGVFMESIVCQSKKTVVARFDEGEDLIVSLKKLALDHNIKSGWFSLIGGLKEIAYGLYENGGYKNIKMTAEHCFELLPMFGNITKKESDILIHAHISASEGKEGKAFGGHLIEGCKIYPFAEVVMQEIDQIVDRSYDPKPNLWPLKFK